MKSIPESNYHSLTRETQTSYISNTPMSIPTVEIKTTNNIIHRLIFYHRTAI